MGFRHFFADGEIVWMFPVLMAMMFIVMIAIRTLMSGRRGFGPMGRGFGMKRGGFRSRVSLEEEKPSAQDRSQYHPAKPPEVNGRLGTPKMQAQLEQARKYKEQINTLIRSTSDQKTHVRLQDLAAQVSAWVKAAEELAEDVHSFHQSTLIQQDLESVPKSIEDLEARLANESDGATRLELERTLANRKNQLATLEQLQDTIIRAEIKIEHTLSALGTIYSQLLTAQSTDQVADYSRLSTEVDEEVRTLEDHLDALREVKLGNN